MFFVASSVPSIYLNLSFTLYNIFLSPVQLIISHPSASLHATAIYNNQVSSVVPKLLHYIVCQNLIWHVNMIFLNEKKIDLE